MHRRDATAQPYGALVTDRLTRTVRRALRCMTVANDGDQLDQMFDAALRHPSPGYALGRLLSRAHRELCMLEVPDGYFELATFADAGNCTAELRADCHHQLDTMWSPDGGGVAQRARIAWSEVQWQDNRFEVVKLTFSGGRFGMDESRWYVLGRDRAACEALVVAVSQWNHEVRGEILVFKEGCFQKSAKLFAAVTSASFDSLVLEGTFKAQILDDFTQFLTSRAAYEEHGVPWKRGALFIGPPGNGKTLCVKALIGRLGIPCIYVQSFESPHATPQAGIETVFRRARSTAPCLLVLEDIDALLVDGTRSYFLNELDGFAANTGVITLATTNHPERLDPSILERPSRFDRKYHFALPTTPTRARYIATWNERLAPALRLTEDGCAQISERTDGFSFAYIQEVFVSSMMRWMNRRDPSGLLAVALEQLELLRAQMQSAPDDDEPPPLEPPSMTPPWMAYPRQR